jgi:energy-coupling factor transporter ATP-binding protein EcfA2
MASQPITYIVGISGPSSSGKTTLARLLHQIFSDLTTGQPNKLHTFIIHEDDFYHPDNKYAPHSSLPQALNLPNTPQNPLHDPPIRRQNPRLGHTHRNKHNRPLKLPHPRPKNRPPAPNPIQQRRPKYIRPARRPRIPHRGTALAGPDPIILDLDLDRVNTFLNRFSGGISPLRAAGRSAREMGWFAPLTTYP